MTAHDPQYLQALALIQQERAPESVPILAPMAARGHGPALLTLGEMKWGGMIDPTPQPVVAREFFRHAAAAGETTAACYLTNLLASGIAGARDWPQALERLAVEAESLPARRAMLDAIEAMALTPEGDPVAAPEGRALSASPEVTLYEGLLSADECAYLRRVADPGYAPSSVYDSQRRLVRDPIRTSDGSTLHWLIEDPAVHAINRRIAAASGHDADCGEAMQILRYAPGQEYRPHFDFVRASDNQRVLTALIWLNEDYEGGETRFLETGLEVKGRTGDMMLFRNALPDRSRDPMAQHAGLPVTKGTKYLASRWIHERRFQP